MEIRFLLVGGGIDTIIFSKDGEIEEDNTLGRVVDHSFKDTKVIHTLPEALPVTAILSMATLVADPDSKCVANEVMEPLLMS